VGAVALSNEYRIETPASGDCFCPSMLSGIAMPQQSRIVGTMSVQ
jgi:hypothetical protein